MTTDWPILTVVGERWRFEPVFSKEIQPLGRPDDIGSSTSGNFTERLSDLKEASKQNLKTIGLVGKDGGAVRNVSIFNYPLPREQGWPPGVHITIGHISVTRWGRNCLTTAEGTRPESLLLARLCPAEAHIAIRTRFCAFGVE